MNPLFTDEERNQAVRNFIVARYHNRAKINSYTAIVPYLREERIKILFPLKKTGAIEKKTQHYDKNNFPIIEVKKEYYYMEDDAKVYFEWLVAVANGSQDASEEIVRQANNQLFQFIHVLEDNIEMDENVQLIASYDWQKLLLSFDTKLTEMKNTIDKGDKDIIEVLKSVLEFMKKNSKLLDAIQAENEKVFGEGM